MTALRLLLKNLDRFRWQFALLLMVSACETVCTFFIPVMLARAASPPIDAEKVWAGVRSLAFLYAASLFLQWLLRRYAEALGPHFSRHLRLKYFNALAQLPFERVVGQHSGYILSLVAKISDGLGGLATGMLWHWLRSIIVLALFIYFTAHESVSVALINACLLLVFVVASTVLSAKMVPLVNALDLKGAALYQCYADFASNISSVKKLGVFPFARTILDQATEDNRAATDRLQRFHANRWFVLHALYGAMYLGTLFFILFRVSSGHMPPSSLVLFLGAFLMLRQQAERISEDFKSLLEVNGFATILAPILIPKDAPSATSAKPLFRTLEVADLEFRYSDSDCTVRIPSLKLNVGEIVLVKGDSGQGKTTLLNLLAGQLTPQKGSILINGAEVHGDLEYRLGGEVVVVSQDVELFCLSLLDNLCLGAEISREHAKAELSHLGLEQWLANLPKELDTLVGEKGVRLSAGQRQRVNLARAMLLQRQVYLIDEPTAHLDPVNEARVVRYLKERLVGKTALVVSHSEAFKGLAHHEYAFISHELRHIDKA